MARYGLIEAQVNEIRAGGANIHGKDSLQDADDEIHRRVVVVQEHDLVQGRGLDPRLLRLEYLALMLFYAH